jgi:C1A family cysteine protease
MMNAAISSKYQLKHSGTEITAANAGLTEDQIRVLRSMGFLTVERLWEALAVSGREFCQMLRLKPSEVGNFAKQLKGAMKAPLQEERRAEFRKISMSTGLIVKNRNDRLLSKRPFETNESRNLRNKILEPSPEGYDLIEKFTSPIRDQGDRGTCAAHSVVRCLEFAEQLSSHNPNCVDLSSQFVYWHAKERDGENGEGTTLADCADVLYDVGTCLEQSFPYRKEPYDDALDPKQRGQKPPSGLMSEAAMHRASNYERFHPQDIDAIKSVLMEKPVAYGIDTYRSWKLSGATMSDVFITLPVGPFDPCEVGHAITLVGYGVDPSTAGGGFFIFDNSWGPEWGKDNQFGAGRGILPFKYAQLYGLEAVALIL